MIVMIVICVKIKLCKPSGGLVGTFIVEIGWYFASRLGGAAYVRDWPTFGQLWPLVATMHLTL